MWCTDAMLNKSQAILKYAALILFSTWYHIDADAASVKP